MGNGAAGVGKTRVWAAEVLNPGRMLALEG